MSFALRCHSSFCCTSKLQHRSQASRTAAQRVARPVISRNERARQYILPHASSDQVPVLYDDDFDSAREAIQSGLSLTKEQRWSDALAVFEKSLSLPGTGLKRFKGKPNELSQGEKITALYNIACCHAKMGDPRSGLVALAGALEAGFGDFEVLRKDPDLAGLREDSRFEGLIQRFEPKSGAFDIFGLFSGKN